MKRHVILLVAATLLCLLPFIGRAFNIDEPLFIWVARHIQQHPLDFYGFQINWYGYLMDASEIIKNPPVASYYIALVAAVGGWSEISLHLGFLLPAVATVLGTYILARTMTAAPVPAALITLLTPVFIVSSVTVMCDTMMLASYVWAIVFWQRGLQRNSHVFFLIAALLVAVSSLTKYYGISLIPLLFIATLASRRTYKLGLVYLLIPVAILACYQWGTQLQYGRGLLLDSAQYATNLQGFNRQSVFTNLITGLAFAGGCLLPTLFFAPFLWGKRGIIVLAGAVLAGALALSQLSFATVPATVSWGYYLQLSLFTVAAVHLFVIAGRDFSKNKNTDSLILLLLLAGGFAFASLVNWSANGRSILPMVPAAGILIARALENRSAGLCDTAMGGYRPLLAPILCAFLISMTIGWTDFSLAESARQAAQEITRSYGGIGQKVWFQGHWGFQYYMEQNGAYAYNFRNPPSDPNLIMALPDNNTNVTFMGEPLQELHFTTMPFAAVMNPTVGAGYYSSVNGPLPFVFCDAPDEKYYLALVNSR